MHPMTFRLPLAAALIVAAFSTQAQSLKDLYEAARAYDASWLAARAQADSAQYRVAQARGLAYGSAALTAGASTTRIDSGVGDGTLRNTQAALNASVPLWNQANWAQIKQAERAQEAAAADLQVAEQDLAVRVARAYFDVLAAQDALATTRTSKAAITEQLASAKRAFEVGTATITDTREAQARYDLATAQEIAAENDLLTRRIALDQLVGRANVQPAPLAVPVVLPAPEPANAESWVTTADAGHPRVHQARLALEVAQLETDRARAAGRPTVDAVGSVGIDRTHGPAMVGGTPGNTKTGTIGLQFNWPLFAGGAIQGRIKETLALQDKAEADLEGARRSVALGTRQAYYGVQSGLAQVKALEAAEASSQLALEATRLGYQVGVRVNLDVLNAQTQLYTTQQNLARARYDVIVAGLVLKQAAGQLNAGDIDAVNGLLATRP